VAEVLSFLNRQDAKAAKEIFYKTRKSRGLDLPSWRLAVVFLTLQSSWAVLVHSLRRGAFSVRWHSCMSCRWQRGQVFLLDAVEK